MVEDRVVSQEHMQEGEMSESIKTANQTRGRPFPPGNRANPHGRRKGSRNKATLILDAMADDEASEVLARVVEAAKSGDIKAAEIVLSRVWPARKGRAVVLDLPEIKTSGDILRALGKTITAMGAGKISPDEAAAIAGVMEQNRRLIETANIEVRLTKLEQEQKK